MKQSPEITLQKECNALKTEKLQKPLLFFFEKISVLSSEESGANLGIPASLRFGE